MSADASTAAPAKPAPSTVLPPPENRVARYISRFLGPAIALLVFGGAIYVLHHELSALKFSDVVSQLRSIPLTNVLLAGLFAALSYLSLTNYDRLAFQYVRQSLPLRNVMAVSFTAFAVGHNVGVAALSGGSIRYRAYSAAGLNAIDIAKIIGFCSMTFVVGAAALLGLALLLESDTMLAHLPIAPEILQIAGYLLVVVPFIYVAGSRIYSGIPLRVRLWTVAWPRTGICVRQIFFASSDLIFAAAVLYAFLPESLAVSYPQLLGAYLIAVGLSVVSSVPGGLGVIEGMLLLLLPEIPQATLLGAVLGYRVIYYFIPLFVALVLLAQQELAAHGERWSRSIQITGLWIGRIAPQILGVTVFLAGAVLVFSGVLPGVSSRMAGIEHLMPLPLLEASSLLSSAVGVALLIVARGLYRRLQGAYYFALALLVTGIAVSLLKGFDYEEALVLAAAAVFLWTGRAEFYRPAALIDQRFTSGWLVSMGIVIGGSIWLGYFQYQHVEYRSDLWWQFAFNADAPRILRGSMVALVVAVGFGLARLMRPAEAEPAEPSAKEFEIVRNVLARSSSALEQIALLGDKRFLVHPSGEAFIMYQTSGRSWIALGDPVGSPQYHEALAWQFRELADRHAARCAFYQVSDEHLPIYLDLGLSLCKLGEEARVDLVQFDLEGSRRAELRQARNRANREGATFEVIETAAVPTILGELRGVSDAWLKDKNASEKGFSLGAFDEEYLMNFDIAVVRVGGDIVAFANLWKSGAREELSIDLMRYSERAPKGIMDYLFTELMLWGKNHGFQYFNLGMAPLSGLETHALATLWHKIGNLVFRFGDHFYNFDGLFRYKAKFDPEWQPRYLAAPGGLATSGVLIDTTVLISGGVTRIFVK